MRVGEKTDYDRLFLEIETDGTILPKEAFYRATKVLLKHFDLFCQTFDEEVSEAKALTPVSKPTKVKKTKKTKKSTPAGGKKKNTK